jgi:hypothetical protein
MPDTTHLTTSEVAAVFDVSIRTASRWADNGDLTSEKIAGGPHGIYLFKPSDVEAFGAALRELAAAPPRDTLPGLEAEPTPADAQ